MCIKVPVHSRHLETSGCPGPSLLPGAPVEAEVIAESASALGQLHEVTQESEMHLLAVLRAQ